MQRALEAALAELALGCAIDANDSAAIDAWLARHEVPLEDAAALRRDFPRLLVYRKLVRRNLRDALEATIPRTIVRLGARFERDFDDFLRDCPPSTHLLKDVTPSFVAFALPRWRAQRVPEYLCDLARHEALQIEVATLLARPQENIAAELALDEPVAFIDAARLVQYDYAVHRLPEDPASSLLPEKRASSLLVYRSPEHEVRYLELAPFAASFLAGLLAARLTLREALLRAARELGRPLDDALLTGSARLLSDLAERGALLGKTEKST